MHRVFAGFIVSLVVSTSAFAQGDPAANYPDRPVKIIVSVPAGGGVDTVTRIYADKLNDPPPPDRVWLIERLESRATSHEG